MNKRQLGSIRSEPTPQSGQNNRSSGDFSMEGASGAIYLEWEISDTANPEAISFKVMCDKSMATDPYLFGGNSIKSGESTQAVDPSIGERKLYIANPSNAQDNFLVTVYGFFN